MNDNRPFLLVRARANPEDREHFAAWFLSSHLRDVANIPGIVAIKSGTTSAGTKLGFYSFESAEVVQQALASPQAAYARGTWEEWAPRLEELLIEIYAPLFPMPVYQSMS